MKTSDSKRETGLIIITVLILIIAVVTLYAVGKYTGTPTSGTVIFSPIQTGERDDGTGQTSPAGGMEFDSYGTSMQVGTPDNGTNINEAFEELWEGE